MSDRIKIVVLDSLPLNPGDLDWSPLHQMGDLTLFEQTAPYQVAERIGDADVVYTNKVRLDAAAFASASHLGLVSVLATGYDIIDLEAARQKNVIVCNVPAYGTSSVAQTAIALLLELTHHVGAHEAAVRKGQWGKAGMFSFWNYPLIELAGKTLLIVGMGAIGSRTAKIAEAMGMRVIAAQLPGRASSQKDEYRRVPLQEALPEADVISLHCPLTPETKGLINADSLTLFKPTAFLINTARGLLVDEAALATALHEKLIGGYACDVLSQEPPSPDNPLLTAPRCIITPHLSWASFESRRRLLNVSIDNLQAFLNGSPQNVVS